MIEERCVFLENGFVGDNEWVSVEHKENPKITAVNWLRTHPEFYSPIWLDESRILSVVVRTPNDKEYLYQIEVTAQFKIVG